MRFTGILVLAAVAIALLTACGGGGGTIGLGPGGPTPPGGMPCPQVLSAMSLVYPAPGSTAIPDAVNSVVVAGPIVTVTLQPMIGPPVMSTSTVPVPSPIPSPNAPSTDPNLKAFAVPPLAAATTYTVIAQDVPGICPEGQPRQLGSFTTR